MEASGFSFIEDNNMIVYGDEDVDDGQEAAPKDVWDAGSALIDLDCIQQPSSKTAISGHATSAGAAGTGAAAGSGVLVSVFSTSYKYNTFRLPGLHRSREWLQFYPGRLYVLWTLGIV